MMTALAEAPVPFARDEFGRPIAADGYPIAGSCDIAEAVVISKLSRSKIYAMIASGELQVRRHGRSRRITWQSIREAFLAVE